jgi:hypothetical protein
MNAPKTAPLELGPNALRAVMERLARGNDDGDGALLLLLVIRMFALERNAMMVVELCSQEIGMLLTLEEPASGLWHAELLRVTMPTLRRVIAEMPELLFAFDHTEQDGTLTLRTRPQTALTARMTPVALPSLDLLLAAGLLSGPNPMRGGVS